METKNKYSKICLLFYFFLLFIIVLPFIQNYPKFIAGGDFDFTDYGMKIQLERNLYVWSVGDGYGGLAMGKYAPMFTGLIITSLSLLFPINLVQLILLISYYSVAFWSIFFVLTEYSSKMSIKDINPLIIPSLSLFYCTNLLTFYFLKLPTYSFLAFFALTPLIGLLIIKLMKSNEKKYFLFLIIAILFNTYTFSNVTTAIIQSIVLFVLIIPFLEKKHIKKLLIIFLIYYLINIPAILEYIMIYLFNRDIMASSQIQQLLLDSAKNVQMELFGFKNIFRILSGDLFGQWWNYLGLVNNFPFKDLYNTPIYLLILFVPIFLLILSILEIKLNKTLLYMAIIFIISLILIAALGFAPLSNFWNLLYTLPFFGIFRNSNKFWPLLIIPLTILLIPILNKRKYYISIFIIYLLFLNVYSISGNLFTKDNFVNLPEEYSIDSINSAMQGIPEGNVGIVYPAKDFFLYGFKWGYMGWSPFLSLQNELSLLHKQGDSLSQANKNIYNHFVDENLSLIKKEDFEKYRVKYIILHKDINYNVFEYYNNYDAVTQYLDREFTLINSNKYYSIYQTFSSNVLLVNSNNLQFQKVNPTKYKLYINNLDGTQDLSFLESYHKEWKLYLKKHPTDSWCNQIEFYENTNTTECKSTQKFFEGEELSYLWKKPVFDNSHEIVYDYANGWTIDSEYIKSHYSNNYYTTNSDGSINVELVMYFKPQSYFYLGILISITTVLACIAYLFYSFFKTKREKP